jgi:hypothetical protein
LNIFAPLLTHDPWDFFNHEENEFSRIGSGFAGEFHCRCDSCSFEKFVVQMFGAWTSKLDELKKINSLDSAPALQQNSKKAAPNARSTIRTIHPSDALPHFSRPHAPCFSNFLSTNKTKQKLVIHFFLAVTEKGEFCVTRQR